MLALEIEGTDIHNHYDLWVIPTVERTDISGAYIFNEVNDEAESLLKQGKTVLIVPDLSRLENSIEGFYCQDFWCYHMFCIISQMMKNLTLLAQWDFLSTMNTLLLQALQGKILNATVVGDSSELTLGYS